MTNLFNPQPIVVPKPDESQLAEVVKDTDQYEGQETVNVPPAIGQLELDL